MNREQHGTQIRVPAVANFMIDSADRAGGSAWEFQITKNQNLANGFFTRIGATEVVLEWDVPNVRKVLISGSYEDQLIQFDIIGEPDALIVTFPIGFYNVSNVLDLIVSSLNQQTTASRFSVVTSPDGVVGIVDSDAGGGFNAVSGQGPLAVNMGFLVDANDVLTANSPDLRPYRFIDFIAPDLTYNQNVKDVTTSLRDQNVIVRWYFAYDNEVSTDKYNFPVLMGYEPFQLRRLYNPPKQIAWSPNMLIGNLAFRVLGTYADYSTDPATMIQEVVNNGDVEGDLRSNWLMTLQLSEN
jgi:hypothetical protein